MSIFYTFPYKNSADDFSPTLFIIEPFILSLHKSISAIFFHNISLRDLLLNRYYRGIFCKKISVGDLLPNRYYKIFKIILFYRLSSSCWFIFI